MLGILWLIRYACSGLHFGNPAAQTAQAQQNAQQSAQNSAQQGQQQAMFNLQNYLAQNPNPFQNIGIQGPQTAQQMPQRMGGGMTTGLPGMLGGGMPPQFGQLPQGPQGSPLPPLPPGMAYDPMQMQQQSGAYGGMGGQPGAPPHMQSGLPQVGGRLPGGGGIRPMPVPMQQPGGAPNLPPALIQQLLQGGGQSGAAPGASGTSGMFRKGSYGNLL